MKLTPMTRMKEWIASLQSMHIAIKVSLVVLFSLVFVQAFFAHQAEAVLLGPADVEKNLYAMDKLPDDYGDGDAHPEGAEFLNIADTSAFIRGYNEATCIPMVLEAKNNAAVPTDVLFEPVFEYSEDGVIGIRDLYRATVHPDDSSKATERKDFRFPRQSLSVAKKAPLVGGGKVDADITGPFKHGGADEAPITETDRYRYYKIYLSEVPAGATVQVPFCAHLAHEAKSTTDEHLVVQLHDPSFKDVRIIRNFIKSEDDLRPELLMFNGDGLEAFDDAGPSMSGAFESTLTAAQNKIKMKHFPNGTCAPGLVKLSHIYPIEREIQFNNLHFTHNIKKMGPIGIETLHFLDSPLYPAITQDNLDDFDFPYSPLTDVTSFETDGADPVGVEITGPFAGTNRTYPLDSDEHNGGHFNMFFEEFPADTTAYIPFCAELGADASEVDHSMNERTRVNLHMYKQRAWFLADDIPVESGSITLVKAFEGDGGLGEADKYLFGSHPMIDGEKKHHIPDGEDSITFADIPVGSYGFNEAGEFDGDTHYDDYIFSHGTGDGCEFDEIGNLSIDLEEGEHITCTFVNKPVDDGRDPDDAAHIKLRKITINDDGGVLDSDDFTMAVFGKGAKVGDTPEDTDEYLTPLFPGDPEGTIVALWEGYFTPMEHARPDGYTRSWHGNCWGYIAPGPVIHAGEFRECIIVNDDESTGTEPAKIIVIKEMVNDDGGTAIPSDFTIDITHAGGEEEITGSSEGTVVVVEPGAYSVEEEAVAGYAADYEYECEGTIAAGETKVCLITNHDAPIVVEPPGPFGDQSLFIDLEIVNDGDGEATEEDFTITIEEVDHESLKVTTQNDGGTFKTGDRVVVQWESSKDTRFNVSLNPVLEDEDDDREQIILGANMRFHGNFIFGFDVPDGAEGDYYIEVVRTTDLARDTNDTPITIEEPKDLEVLTQNEGGSFKTGERVTVRWASSKDTRFNVNLNPVKEDDTDTRTQIIVGRNMRFHGNYLFSFEMPPEAIGDYKVQVIRLTDMERDSNDLAFNVVGDLELTAFSLAAVSSDSGMIMLSQNNGGNFIPGQEVYIKWKSDAEGEFNVNLNPVIDGVDDTREQIVVGRNMRFGGNTIWHFTMPAEATGKYHIQVLRTRDGISDSNDEPITVGPFADADPIGGLEGPLTFDDFFTPQEVAPDTTFEMPTGTFKVRATGPDGYEITFWGDCNIFGAIDIESGEHDTCLIIADDEGTGSGGGGGGGGGSGGGGDDATLTIDITIINDEDGTRTDEDFEVFVDGSPVAKSTAIGLAPDTYTISATSFSYYTYTFGGDCDASGEVILEDGDADTCTILIEDEERPSGGGGGGSGGGGSSGGGGGGGSTPPPVDPPETPEPPQGQVLGISDDEPAVGGSELTEEKPEPKVLGATDELPRTGIPAGALLAIFSGTFALSRLRRKE